jgi:hypothetical protein
MEAARGPTAIPQPASAADPSQQFRAIDLARGERHCGGLQDVLIEDDARHARRTVDIRPDPRT